MDSKNKLKKSLKLNTAALGDRILRSFSGAEEVEKSF
jgi:hypothetical protein